MNRTIILAAMLLATASLSACEKTKEQFNFSKKAPDEFAIVKRAPLEMPPDFNALPTPNPGADRPQEQSVASQARASVLGETVPGQQAAASQGEAVLLQKAGATNARHDVRAAIDQETAEIAKEETPTIDRIMGLTGKKVEEPAVEVDPTAETNRLKSNKAAGKPVTAGETAIKEDE